MNHKTILLSSITLLLVPISLFSNTTPVTVTTIQNNTSVKLSMNVEIEGTIKLYSVATEDTEAAGEKLQPVSDVAFINWVLDPDKDFYIGTGEEAEVITPSNYKRLAKKYFEASPELAKRIGKRGFRYKNLPSMIIYYNKMMANEGGLTRADIICSN